MALEGETRDSSDDALEQRVADLEAEIESLRDQLADRDRYIEELEARLKRYENANTPSSRRGEPRLRLIPPNNDDTDDDEESDTDSESSPGRNPGHEGMTQPPPDPDRTVRVEEACCPDCGRVLTDPDEDTREAVNDWHYWEGDGTQLC